MSIPNTNEIDTYIHCAQCFDNDVAHILAAGWTERGLQLWCENCESNVMHVDFEGHAHPANTARIPKPPLRSV